LNEKIAGGTALDPARGSCKHGGKSAAVLRKSLAQRVIWVILQEYYVELTLLKCSLMERLLPIRFVCCGGGSQTTRNTDKGEWIFAVAHATRKANGGEAKAHWIRSAVISESHPTFLVALISHVFISVGGRLPVHKTGREEHQQGAANSSRERTAKAE
jgi:hypothetical protein